MAKKKKKNVNNFKSLIQKKLIIKNIEIIPKDLVKNTRTKITNFY